MNKDTHEMLDRLERAGITIDDAYQLRRIAMTLQRWYELECGTDGGWYVEREDDGEGVPHMKNADTGRDHGRIPDREAGALKRLNSIMANYPDYIGYVQSDPRGAALYIVRKTDVPKGADIDAYYNRGIAVFK